MCLINYIDRLPHELLTEIFTRLPGKSLGSCKCVSKPWSSLISHPNFIQAHLTKTKNFSTSLTLVSPRNPPGILYSLHFYENNKDFNYDGVATKLNLKCSNIWRKVWGSYDGLVLVEDKFKELFLINPTTLEFKKLPDKPFPDPDISCFNVYGFGYDSSCDDYVVVAICLNKKFCAYFYMLKTNQWNEVGYSPCHNFAFPDSAVGVAGISLRGSLHWLSKKNYDRDSCLFITAFNVAKKEFFQVLTPDGVFDCRSRCLRLGVLKGCLCLTALVSSRRVELWVMKDYGVVESWVKLSVFLTEDSTILSLDFPEDSLLMLEAGRFVLLTSNAEEATLQDMKFVGLPHDFQVGMTFVDSLLSPNMIEIQEGA